MSATLDRTRVLDAPRLASPLEGDVVDAAAPAFRWRPVPGADRYTLQVASDRRGQSVLATLDAGAATELVVHDLLRPQQAPLFWRVRAEAGDGAGTWSAPGRFVAGTDRAVDAFLAQRDAARQEATRSEVQRKAAEQRALDLVPPHSRPDQLPSDGQIRLIGLLLLCGMLVTGLAIFLASRAL